MRFSDALAAARSSALTRGPEIPSAYPRKLIAAVVGVVAVASVILAAWYVVSAHALDDSSGALERMTVPVGQTVYFGPPVAPIGGPEATVQIDLRSVTPKIVENTADATVAVLFCTGPRAGGLVAGGTVDEAASSCNQLSAFHPHQLRLGPDGSGTITTGIVVAVTPHRPGVVHIRGAQVSYWQGIRHGSQHVGMDVTIATR